MTKDWSPKFRAEDYEYIHIDPAIPGPGSRVLCRILYGHRRPKNLLERIWCWWHRERGVPYTEILPPPEVKGD